MTDLSRASASDDGVARRTILAGAAWSIPVIATATVAPAASASGTLALAFNQASYTGTACSTITGAYVTATDNGGAVPGAPVTVTLSNGYTFAGGATTMSSVTDANGRVAISSISAPGYGGTATISATTGSSSAYSTVSSAAPWVPGYFDQVGYHATSNVPANATAAFSNLFLTPTNTLVNSTGGANLVGFKMYGEPYRMGNGAYRIGILLADGTTLVENSGIRTATSNVPLNSTPVFSNWFLTPSGQLVGSNGSLVLSDVSSFGKVYYKNDGSSFKVAVSLTNGGTGWFEDSVYNSTTGVPSGSKPAFSDQFITPSNALVGRNGSVLLTGVTSVGEPYSLGSGQYKVGILKTDGSTLVEVNGARTATTNVPPFSRPAFSDLFITPAGDLVGPTGSLITQHVAGFGKLYYTSSGTEYRIGITRSFDC
ncbi:hypothetical protein [Microbacterium sp.]|uniref:hypothetical protein n=1 Tax=Microbacterium sp. TaxID=51671 RepID=UPI0025EF79F5|nr:hypothetical protein [Microbacterium sp.]MBT9606121.1 hypothetical protein [Microbacterium sp.]